MLALDKWFLGLTGDWIEITNSREKKSDKRNKPRNNRDIRVSDKHFEVTVISILKRRLVKIWRFISENWNP